jgi:hypothetical protein
MLPAECLPVVTALREVVVCPDLTVIATSPFTNIFAVGVFVE